MSFTEIDYKVDGRTAIVTLNRPDSLNAWTATMGNEVRQAMRQALVTIRIGGGESGDRLGRESGGGRGHERTPDLMRA